MMPRLKLATRKDVVFRSLKVAILVGSTLNIINQYDAIFGAGSFNGVQAVLTFCVPFCVATYGAVMAMDVAGS